MLKLGRAQGVVISAARYFGLCYRIFSSKNQTIRSRKWEMHQRTSCRMIEKQFSVNLQNVGLDATDTFRCYAVILFLKVDFSQKAAVKIGQIS